MALVEVERPGHSDLPMIAGDSARGTRIRGILDHANIATVAESLALHFGYRDKARRELARTRRPPPA